jgi:tetratricopeptide (TPR) repeat protein
MRLASVTAKSFGAIVDRTLTLPDGLTVVYGDNGTGKSTWHAALYAALCGFPVSPSEFDRAFETERAPADGEWAVDADIVTAAGERFEVAQDLRTHRSTVWRAGTPSGRDHTVDFSRMLRLDRYSYAATSFIEQEDTAGLRRRLFDVASTFVRDTEATAALNALRERQTYLGLAGSGGRLDWARERYEAAHDQANELLRLQRQKVEAEKDLRDARAAEARLRHQVRLGDAAEAKATVRDIKRRIRALEPADESATMVLASGALPPPSTAQRHERVATAERALTAADAEYERLAVPLPPVVADPPPPVDVVEPEPEPDLDPPTVDIPIVAPVQRNRERSLALPLTIAVTLAVAGIAIGLFGQLVIAGILIATAIVIIGALVLREQWPATTSPAPLSHATTDPARMASAHGRSSAGSGNGPQSTVTLPRAGRGSPTSDGTVLTFRRPDASLLTGSPTPYGTAGTFGQINTGPVTALPSPDGSVATSGHPNLPYTRLSVDLAPESIHSGLDEDRPATVGSAEELRRAQQAVDRALLNLELALAAVPFPLGHQGVRAAYERYEDDRERRVAEEARHQAALRHLERELADAEETARQRALDLDHYEIESVWPMLANVEDADSLGRERLELDREELTRAEGAIGPLAERLDELAAAIAHAVNGGRDPIALRDEAARQLERLQTLRTVLDDATEALSRARTQALRDVSEAINQNLAENLPGVIDIPDMRINLDPEFNVLVKERARGTNKWGPGSNSTKRLARLFARVALGSFIARQVSAGGGGGERAPLLIDELAGEANGTRQVRTLEWLLGIAGARQVVLFTADTNALEWAKRRRPTESRLNLLWLGGVDDAPEPYQGQDEPAA